MKYFILIVLALVLLACPSAIAATRVFSEAILPANTELIPVTAPESFEGCGGIVFQPINNAFEQAVVEQTNQIRMEAGLPPLKRVENLDYSARYHTADMAANDYFSHDTFDEKNGDLFFVCDTWSRIESFYPDWYALAENIAAGQLSPESALEGWMNSPDHRHNILSDSYWEIGVGYYEGDGEYHYYWGQNFGRTNNQYPLVIEGEKSGTSSRSVALFIYGDWNEIRLRNDVDEWSEWIPFHNEMRWTLPEEPGLHTVSAEMRGNKTRASSSDRIEYKP